MSEDKFKYKDFRVKEFISRCNLREYHRTLYAGPHTRRDGDNQISFTIERSPHDVMGLIFPRELFKLIREVQIIVNGNYMRRDVSRLDLENSGAWIGNIDSEYAGGVNKDDMLVVPLRVSAGYSVLDVRLSLLSVAEHTNLKLIALFDACETQTDSPAVVEQFCLADCVYAFFGGLCIGAAGVGLVWCFL